MKWLILILCLITSLAYAAPVDVVFTEAPVTSEIYNSTGSVDQSIYCTTPTFKVTIVNCGEVEILHCNDQKQCTVLGDIKTSPLVHLMTGEEQEEMDDYYGSGNRGEGLDMSSLYRNW